MQMATTVTAIQRAANEAAQLLNMRPRDARTEDDRLMLAYLSKSPTALTILANRLSDRGEAGNAAVARNLAEMRATVRAMRFGGPIPLTAETLEWAIDQLTPPQPASFAGMPVVVDPSLPPGVVVLRTDGTARKADTDTTYHVVKRDGDD
jgi:hypothetical protein